jgi:hypothetical protein
MNKERGHFYERETMGSGTGVDERIACRGTPLRTRISAKTDQAVAGLRTSFRNFYCFRDNKKKVAHWYHACC